MLLLKWFHLIVLWFLESFLVSDKYLKKDQKNSVEIVLLQSFDRLLRIIEIV